jgi:glucan phosphoethanolaminetransferase (alkaline phosphatase superfamily)
MLRMKGKGIKILACYLVVAVFAIGFAQKVYAGFSPSEVVNASAFDRAEDLQKIQKVLELKMVSEKLKELGFTQEEIQERLDQLSDEQIHQVALNLDELKVGGNGFGIIIGLLVIAILVVLLIFLLKKI